MRRRTRYPAALAGLSALLLAACAAPGASPASDSAGRAEGVVRVVGSAPMDVHVVVQDEDGGAVRVVGAMRDEIGRISGARVVVHGRLDRSTDPVAPHQIDASDYEISSINGEPVLQGTVQGKTAGWTVLRTRDGETVYLSSAPDSFRTGQKVWVQGQRSLIVQSHGVLR